MPYSEADAAQVRSFFQSPSGQNFLEFIRAGAPAFETDNMEKAALSSQRVMGYNKALERMQQALDFSQDAPQERVKFINTNELDTKE